MATNSELVRMLQDQFGTDFSNESVAHHSDGSSARTTLIEGDTVDIRAVETFPAASLATLPDLRIAVPVDFELFIERVV